MADHARQQRHGDNFGGQGYLFSPSQLGRLTGSCCLFLQDAKSAADVLEATALELQDQSKSQAVVLGNLALAYIRLGALDAAVAKLNLAIDVTERNRGGGGHEHHPHRWPPAAPVAGQH
jgi:hypothetical protein